MCSSRSLASLTHVLISLTHVFVVYKPPFSPTGYDGVNEMKGHEYVRLKGVSNRAVLMRAFGYAAGSVSVEYTYYEDVKGAVPAPSIDFQIPYNHHNHRTDRFSDVPESVLIARRAGTVEMNIVAPGSIDYSQVDVEITGTRTDIGGDDTKPASLLTEASEAPILTLRPLFKKPPNILI